MDLFVGVSSIGAAVAAVVWIGTAVIVRPVIYTQAVLHLVTIYLSILAFVGFDTLIVLGLSHVLDQFTLRLIFSFVMGIQLVAAISAFLFVRSWARHH